MNDEKKKNEKSEPLGRTGTMFANIVAFQKCSLKLPVCTPFLPWQGNYNRLFLKKRTILNLPLDRLHKKYASFVAGKDLSSLYLSAGYHRFGRMWHMQEEQEEGASFRFSFFFLWDLVFIESSDCITNGDLNSNSCWRLQRTIHCGWYVVPRGSNFLIFSINFSVQKKKCLFLIRCFLSVRPTHFL